MGSLQAASALPIVEIGKIEEHLFTDIEIELVAGRCARFTLLCEQRPVDCQNPRAENLVKVRCTTLVELVPFMIRKTVFALGKHWGQSMKGGLLMPL
jgi:hypothetical protein